MKPDFLAVLAAVLLAAPAAAAPAAKPDLREFAALPVLSGGRVKPIDTIARASLLMLRGKQTLRHEGRSMPAIEWLLDLMARPEQADLYKVFVINDPDVLGVLGREQGTEKYFSFKDLEPKLEELETQASRAQKLEAGERDRFQSAVVNLWDRVGLYQRLKNTLQIAGTPDLTAELEAFGKALGPGIAALHAAQGPDRRKADLKAAAALEAFLEKWSFIAEAAYFHNLPPLEGEPPEAWRNLGSALMDAMRGTAPHPGIGTYSHLLRAWRAQDSEAFAAAVSDFDAWLLERRAKERRLARWETVFNRVQPFYLGTVLYGLALLLLFSSWLTRPETLRKAAFGALCAGFAFHLAGQVARMVIEGRPPVTNLYSSAVFVGLIAVLLGVILERRYRNGGGILASGSVGFATLIIAHHLASQGDTMEMMRAVLDSNFWLGTHVVTITIGYSATFLAGTLGLAYILRGTLTRSLDKATGSGLVAMAYGIICFALFFSFVGTVLGGIWADQSWGRFWGWDPKENGALLIVLWNAIILHARWGGLVRERGIMIMAVAGNIVTALSWFGVNMLGIGLHSYGFMDKAFWWLAAFVLSQVLIMLLGSLEPGKWRSAPALRA